MPVSSTHSPEENLSSNQKATDVDPNAQLQECKVISTEAWWRRSEKHVMFIVPSLEKRWGELLAGTRQFRFAARHI